MLTSFFNLIKTNEGKFKSEKQALFFMDRYDGLYSINETFYRNPISWDVSFDITGVQKITKTTIKGGSVVYWENTQEHLDMLKEKEAAKFESGKVEAKDHLDNCAKYSTEIINSLYSDYIKFEDEKNLQRIIDVLGYDKFNEIKQGIKDKINKEMENFQEAIKWTHKFLKEDK